MMIFMDKSWKDGFDIFVWGENGVVIVFFGLWIFFCFFQIIVFIVLVLFECVYIIFDFFFQR